MLDVAVKSAGLDGLAARQIVFVSCNSWDALGFFPAG